MAISPDDRLKATVTLSSGRHSLSIAAVDQFGATAKTTRSVSVPCRGPHPDSEGKFVRIPFLHSAVYSNQA